MANFQFQFNAAIKDINGHSRELKIINKLPTSITRMIRSGSYWLLASFKTTTTRCEVNLRRTKTRAKQQSDEPSSSDDVRRRKLHSTFKRASVGVDIMSEMRRKTVLSDGRFDTHISERDRLAWFCSKKETFVD